MVWIWRDGLVVIKRESGWASEWGAVSNLDSRWRSYFHFLFLDEGFLTLLLWFLYLTSVFKGAHLKTWCCAHRPRVYSFFFVNTYMTIGIDRGCYLRDEWVLILHNLICCADEKKDVLLLDGYIFSGLSDELKQQIVVSSALTRMWIACMSVSVSLIIIYSKNIRL